MPNQSHSGHQGVPWHRCDRCGFDFPVSQLIRQNGLLLDAKCRDREGDASSQDLRRRNMIQERLANSEDEAGLAGILTDSTSDTVD